MEDSYGFGWYHAVHPDDLDAVRRAWAGVGTDRLELEFRLRKWDGEYRWHLVCPSLPSSHLSSLLLYVGSMHGTTPCAREYTDGIW